VCVGQARLAVEIPAGVVQNDIGIDLGTPVGLTVVTEGDPRVHGRPSLSWPGRRPCWTAILRASTARDWSSSTGGSALPSSRSGTPLGTHLGVGMRRFIDGRTG
jgi:hypothetical protein